MGLANGGTFPEGWYTVNTIIDGLRDRQSEPTVEALLYNQSRSLTRHERLAQIVNTATVIALTFIAFAAWGGSGQMWW